MQPKARAVLGRLTDIDLRLLRVFKAVADCGGMAAAELELNIAMSTISRHVKDLEERLGLVLCRRAPSLPRAAENFRAALVSAHTQSDNKDTVVSWR